MNTTPASLLERLRGRVEAEAWDRFVHLYTPLLFHWARQTGLQESDAADLVQDVFVVLLRKLPEFTYDRHKSFRAWLRTVTLNKWREWQRRPSLVVAAGGEALEEVPAPDVMSVFEEAEYRRHVIGQALEILRPEFPQRTWQAFWRYAVLGEDAAAVAEGLGLSPGSVYAAKSRVLAGLRREVAGLLD
jgi:RNA polymerase sigma-70 factor (ECF subfamily)